MKGETEDLEKNPGDASSPKKIQYPKGIAVVMIIFSI
jgi:hypothetical protein